MAEAWTRLKLLQWTAQHFEKLGVPNPRLDAELLLAHILKCPRIDLYTRHDQTVSEKDRERFRDLVVRRARREPLQYIVGDAEFWGLKFRVTPEVLIPRPETERLVEEALRIVKGQGAPQILEIGTGSGCIAITLAREIPTAGICATEISRPAIELARHNAQHLEVTDRIDFRLADIAPWRSFETEGRRFDLVVSNPPYIATDDFPKLQPEVRDFEPRQALDGGCAGLQVIRKILTEAPGCLRPGGHLLLEIGAGQATRLRELEGEVVGLRLCAIEKDYAGVDRIALWRLEGKTHLPLPQGSSKNRPDGKNPHPGREEA